MCLKVNINQIKLNKKINKYIMKNVIAIINKQNAIKINK